jgi:hypothetical protein
MASTYDVSLTAARISLAECLQLSFPRRRESIPSSRQCTTGGEITS